ncbi:hypothetical protein LTR56_014501 [Elasticomyces elasticus]|nr:hypothetical protein LTR56_014501 [Elasticomyces elasticus]KAK3667700.1 hypothetical protein LTR22_001515 [Elasticomyces elasticus]KAK4920806.1 hypothetical protein LTR49_011709 [Elasticomyces elasticus]KAK5767147.1 hypothetical protein LTS12_002605 [Elasticomyces elasticus]
MRTLLGLNTNTTPPYEVVVKPRHVRKAEEKAQRDVQAQNYREKMARRRSRKDRADAHEKARRKRRFDESKVNAADPKAVAEEESPGSQSEYDSATEEISQGQELPRDTPVSDKSTGDAVDAVDATLQLPSERLTVIFLWAARTFVAVRDAIDGQLAGLITPSTTSTPQQPQESMMDVALALSNVKHPQYDKVEARRIVWRTVLRSNYFWLHPDTNEPTSIRLPFACVGSTEEDYVHWLAEQEVEVGRTIPTASHVDEVRKELFTFLNRARDSSFLLQIAHLAFLCKYEEDLTALSPRALSLTELRTRIGLAFSKVSMTEWANFKTFKPVEIGEEGGKDTGAELAELESIWAAVQDTRRDAYHVCRECLDCTMAMLASDYIDARNLFSQFTE